ETAARAVKARKEVAQGAMNRARRLLASRQRSFSLMPLNPERGEELLKTTREAAAAFMEDMPHIQEIVLKTDPDRAELRRLSNVLRRLLIDKGGDLRDIAAPRVGKLNIIAPDNKPFY